jgi:acyl carrier protein
MNVMSGNTTEARELLAQVLNIPVDELEHDAAIGRTERWDSLAHLHLILALEAHLG